MKSEGVRHEHTIPKTPEQNGVAERMNRTLVETVRSMLIDAQLPQSFWAEALSTAVYLKNRSPTRALKVATPYESWMKEKPNVEHLRVFGCDAYAHIAKDERKKLDSKSRKCIFLGYGETTKGYRLYDPNRAKVIYSRDVQFNERRRMTADFQTDTQSKPVDHCVELESFCDEQFDDEISQTDCTNEIAETDYSNESNESSTEFTVRRSQRVKRALEFYGERANFADSQPAVPTTLKDVLASPEKDKWIEAMKKEMKSLNDNDVWDLCHLPEDKNVVGSKWVFKLKTGAEGTVVRYKARLVAQGFSQKFGTDYDETFCPVVRLESLRTLVALSVQYGLKLHQIDVTTAFLNGELKEEVFMKQPVGFIKEGQEHLVCRLKRSIYGFKTVSTLLEFCLA